MLNFSKDLQNKQKLRTSACYTLVLGVAKKQLVYLERLTMGKKDNTSMRHKKKTDVLQ